MELMISGYGTKPANTIALYDFDGEASVLLKWQTSIEQASFICEGDGYLFAITEEDEQAYVYLLQRMEDRYLLLDKRYIEGGALCHIAYSHHNKALFGACYATGTIFSIRVEDGKFGELLHHEIQKGEEESSLTRAHCVLLNKAETELAVINIALDKVFFYQVSNGYLSLSWILEVPIGVGPRHAIYSEDESLLYIITEYSNELLIYGMQQKKLKQRYSTLPSGYKGESNCSTLCFSKDRSYLYAANRGADTIALFQVHSDGLLTRLREFTCGGNHPRHMIVTFDGNYLIVCNQHSDNVAIFKLDHNSGDLQILLSFNFPKPSGMLAW